MKSGTYEALIISGEPTEVQLKSAWYLIISEYHALKEINIAENKQWSLSRQILRINNHLFLLQMCINFLKETYSAEVAKQVRKLGYSFKPVSQDPKEYTHLLFEIAETAKTKFVELEQLNKQFEEFLATQEETVPTEVYFRKRLINIEEMQGVAYDMDTLTVSKFITLDNKYIEYCNMLELKNKKRA